MKDLELEGRWNWQQMILLEQRSELELVLESIIVQILSILWFPANKAGVGMSIPVK